MVSAAVYPTIAATAVTPTATLAQARANTSVNATMFLPEGERFTSPDDSSLSDELHSQYSFIAVIVLMSLFLTITLSATGFLLAFCKKKNTVFSLQKCEQDSQFEMDDLENTDIESCNEDLKDSDSALEVKASTAGKKRSPTTTTVAATTTTTAFEIHSHQHAALPLHRQPQSPAACTPLVPKVKVLKPLPHSARRNGHCDPAMTSKRQSPDATTPARSFTVAAIHHPQQCCLHAEADRGVVVEVTGNAGSDVLDAWFGRSSTHSNDSYTSEWHDSDTDDHANDQTVALLHC